MDYELFYGSLQISFSASVVESNSIVSRNNTNFFAKYQPTEFPWHLMLQQDTSCVLGSVGKTIFLIVHCWIICAVLFLFHSCLQDELFLMTENTFLYHPWSDSAGISFFFVMQAINVSISDLGEWRSTLLTQKKINTFF